MKVKLPKIDNSASAGAVCAILVLSSLQVLNLPLNAWDAIHWAQWLSFILGFTMLASGLLLIFGIRSGWVLALLAVVATLLWILYAVIQHPVLMKSSDYLVEGSKNVLILWIIIARLGKNKPNQPAQTRSLARPV